MKKLLLIFTLLFPIICSDVFSEDDFDEYDERIDRIDLTCFYDSGFLEYQPNHPLDVTFSTDGKDLYVDNEKPKWDGYEHGAKVEVKKKKGENIFIYYQHYPRWIGEHSGLEHGGYTKEIYVNFNKGRAIHYGNELNCY